MPPPCDPLDEMAAVPQMAAPTPAKIMEIKKVDLPVLPPEVILASAPPIALQPQEIKKEDPPAMPLPPSLPGQAATVPVVPPASIAQQKIDGPKMIVLFLRETGDRARDTRRLRILYGLLTSYPGEDRFAFHISEAQRTYRLEFPANTTAWSAELERQVNHLVGTGCIEVQPWTVQ